MLHRPEVVVKDVKVDYLKERHVNTYKKLLSAFNLPDSTALLAALFHITIMDDKWVSVKDIQLWCTLDASTIHQHLAICQKAGLCHKRVGSTGNQYCFDGYYRWLSYLQSESLVEGGSL